MNFIVLWWSWQADNFRNAQTHLINWSTCCYWPKWEIINIGTTTLPVLDITIWIYVGYVRVLSLERSLRVSSYREDSVGSNRYTGVATDCVKLFLGELKSTQYILYLGTWRSFLVQCQLSACFTSLQCNKLNLLLTTLVASSSPQGLYSSWVFGSSCYTR